MRNLNRYLKIKLRVWLCVGIVLACGSRADADIISTFGDQDFAEGTTVLSEAAFLAPQTGESAPIGIHIDPSTFSWTHNFAPINSAATLTISLWDLDANFPGNQVTAFTVNGIAQDLSIFEAFQDGDLVHLYQADLAAGLLNSGVANVSITLGNLETNSVGFDFARISTVPEPSSLFLVGLCAAGLGYVRSRSGVLAQNRQA